MIQADLLAAIDKTWWDESDIPPRMRRQGWEQHNAHLETLRALLVDGCCLRDDCGDNRCEFMRAIVADALIRMGALRGE